MTLSSLEFFVRSVDWVRGRKRELQCMPVIDWVKEREETDYCDKGRQIWDPDGNPGGPSRTDMPIVQLDLRWPNKRGLRMVPLVLQALQDGFVQGCIVESPDGSDYYRAFVCLTYKGRRSWNRYCSDRRMKRRSRVFFMGTHYGVSAQFRKRDPRTEWSLYPPESPERMHQRSGADVTYGCITPDIKAKMAEAEA